MDSHLPSYSFTPYICHEYRHHEFPETTQAVHTEVLEIRTSGADWISIPIALFGCLQSPGPKKSPHEDRRIVYKASQIIREDDFLIPLKCSEPETGRLAISKSKRKNFVFLLVKATDCRTTAGSALARSLARKLEG